MKESLLKVTTLPLTWYVLNIFELLIVIIGLNILIIMVNKIDTVLALMELTVSLDYNTPKAYSNVICPLDIRSSM